MAQPGETKESNQSGGGDTNPNSSGANLATTTSLPTSTSTATSAHEQDDRDFDPTAQALVDEVDDERTLEEEEALAGDNAAAVQNELEDLKKESEMPIEELLAYYQRMREEGIEGGEDEDEEEEEEEEEMEDDDELDDDEDDENVTENQQSRQRQLHQEQPSTLSQPTETDLSNPPKNLLNHQIHSQSGISKTNAHAETETLNLGTTLEQRSGQQHHVQFPDRCSNSTMALQSEYGSSTGISMASRPKHSMTEFLIGSDASADGMFKTLLGCDLDDSDDLDEDYSYTDDENDDGRDWRRSIHIGPEHQADVPEGLSLYESDLPPYETEDKLVWWCGPNVTQEDILSYLKLASMIPKRNDISISPASVPRISDDAIRIYRERLQDQTTAPEIDSTEPNDENIIIKNLPENLHDVYMSQSRKRAKIDYELEQENALDGLNQSCDDYRVVQQPPSSLGDDTSTMTSSQGARHELSSTEEYFQDEEQLLYLLLQCNHNIEEALRRRKLDPFKYYIHEPMSLWSQDECLGFEHGLRTFGKDFLKIRENEVPTRTRAEIVAFYYLWKKSERHDVYTNQYKLDRKRCLSHPGTTDYMDKFIEDNESALNASATPTPTPFDSALEVNQTSEFNHSYNPTLLLPHAPEIKQAQLLQQPTIQQTSIQRMNMQDDISTPKAHYEMRQGSGD